MLATGLVAAGIRSLRYDKRGMGGSQALVAREQDVIFDDFVNDAVTMIRALSQRAEVSSVFVLGHSEGGIIALRAASMVPFAGLVLAATPGRPLAVVLRFQLRAALTPESLRDEALQILELLVKGERVAECHSR